MRLIPIIAIIMLILTFVLAGCAKEIPEVESQESAIEPAVGEIEDMPDASEDIDVLSDDEVDIGGDLI